MSRKANDAERAIRLARMRSRTSRNANDAAASARLADAHSFDVEKLIRTRLTPEEAVLANRQVRSRFLVPIHWGTFNLARHRWDEPPERMLRAAQAAGIRLGLLEPGGSLEPGDCRGAGDVGNPGNLAALKGQPGLSPGSVVSPWWREDGRQAP